MADLFLSYSRADIETVRAVQRLLESHGVRTFVDWNDLAAGLPWPVALERALENARAVAVFIGPSGYGLWQKREISYALDLQAAAERNGNGRRFPVVPVLLRGGDPPIGFLKLNTWVDLRDGISEEAISPLLRTLENAEAPPSKPDLCPYRDLRAFREEDAALFFGRDEPVGMLMQRLDRSSVIAVVGPSGSGKSSVVLAGVLPRLRAQRPPRIVWEFLSFLPGDNPWRRFADALLSLLDPEISEASRLNEVLQLAEALQREGGIAASIDRVLQKSGGSQRLLLVIDQFEELFTLTDAATARAFVRAIIAATAHAPFTVMLTLRSDYYGKAIGIDRELSNCLPEAQVNLGPVQRDELREAIVRPAAAAGLRFESGLVDQILEDVGDEPGNLPLLEYALTELWKLRENGELTFAAYREVGQVSGALAQRANLIYDGLSDAGKAAARRLMMRLVRVSAADEEGADTRRRARRGELDAEAWNLVQTFASAPARLLVAGTDPVSGEEIVEVAHEALIRKWDRLCEWIAADRAFLVWRQQLAVYRNAWHASGEEDDEMLLRGTALAEAERWLRSHRAELNDEERHYIERSAAKKTRRRLSTRIAAAAAVVAVLILAAWLIVPRTDYYNVRRIMKEDIDVSVFNDQRDVIALIRLGMQSRMEKAIRTTEEAKYRVFAWCSLARALHVLKREDRAMAALRAAQDDIARTKAEDRADVLLAVANTYLDNGHAEAAPPLIEEADRHAAESNHEAMRKRSVAEAWRKAGQPQRAGAILADLRQRVPSASPEFRAVWLIQTAQAFAEHGDRQTALSLLDEARPISEGSVNYILAYAYARTSDDPRAALAIPQPIGLEEGVQSGVIAELVKRRRYAEAEQLAMQRRPGILFERANMLGFYIKDLVEAGEIDRAQQAAARLTHEKNADEEIADAYALLVEPLQRAGRSREAEEAFRIAVDAWTKMDSANRDRSSPALATAYAAMGRYKRARDIARDIDDDKARRQAYLSILRVYSESR